MNRTREPGLSVQTASVEASEKMLKFDAYQYHLNMTPGRSSIKISKPRPTSEKHRDCFKNPRCLAESIVHASIVLQPGYKALGMGIVR